jgi:multidrug efflux system outer membrane protein
MLKRSFVILPALLIGACAVGPEFAPPAAELPANFAEASDAMFNEAPAASDFWQGFDDPTLSALIARALQENTGIERALATLNETRALAGLAVYSMVPTVETFVDQQRNRQSPVDPFGFPQPSAVERHQAGFNLSWEIDLFGRLRNANRAIRQRAEADAAALGAVQISITAEVAQSYFALRGAEQRLRVQQRNLENQAQSVRILEASLQAGRGTSLDVARARSLERSLAAQIPQSEAAVARAEQRLAVLTAQPIEALRAQIAEGELPTVPDMIPIGTPEDWLRRRPDVYAAERRLAEAVSQVGVETSEYYPRLTLLGSFGWASSERSDLGSDEAERWSLGPSLSWRILEFGRIRQTVRAAEARADGAYSAFEETLLLAIEETENGLASYRAASLTALALGEALEQSRTGSRLARLRFDNGVTDYLAVLDAERTQLDLEVQYAQALTDRATTLAMLYKALGGDFATAVAGVSTAATR